MLRIFFDLISEHQDSNDVRNAHGCIEDIGQSPDSTFSQNGTDEDDDDPRCLIDLDRLFAKEILDAVFAIVAPTQDRRIGKCQDTECQ